jgi:hypothetical protein
LKYELLKSESSSVTSEKMLATPEADESLEIEPENKATIRKVCGLWNEILAPIGFPAVRKPTSVRIKHFDARLNDEPERQEISWWHDLFLEVSRSEWLLGEAQKHANWLTFDWFMNENNLVKVLEGKYANHSGDDYDDGPFDLSGVTFYRENDGEDEEPTVNYSAPPPEEPPPEPDEFFVLDDEYEEFPSDGEGLNYVGNGKP